MRTMPFADVSGRWSLVYSTNDDGSRGSLGPLAAMVDEDTFQRVSNQLYKLFFSFAPALAGSSETGAKGVSNEQIVDLAAGEVMNNVDVSLPWPLEGAVVRVGVSGAGGSQKGGGEGGEASRPTQSKPPSLSRLSFRSLSLTTTKCLL